MTAFKKITLLALIMILILPISYVQYFTVCWGLPIGVLGGGGLMSWTLATILFSGYHGNHQL
jgi:hypothetical protein